MRKTKKLLAFLLALALCVTPAVWTNAEETDTTNPATEAAQFEGIVFDNVTKAEVSEMTPGIVTTGTQKDIESKRKLYTMALKCVTDKYSSKGQAVFKVTLPQKGILELIVQPESSTIPSSASVYADLYTDEACTNRVSFSSTTNLSLNILDKGTYYFSVKVTDYSATQVDAYGFYAGLTLIPGGNQTLKNKTWKMVASKDSSTPNYYKISVPKASKITVEGEFEYGGNITLCNSKKKAVSEKVYVSASKGGKAYFAVPKGTYYIKVAASDDYYRIRYTLGTVKNQTGASKSSAKSLAIKGAKLNGYFTTADKTGKQQWFKFNNTKNQKIVVYVNSELSSGNIKIEFFSSNGKSMGTSTLSSYRTSEKLRPYTIGYGYSGNTLAKGTYYIKITKGTKNTSGTYDFQIKTK